MNEERGQADPIHLFDYSESGECRNQKPRGEVSSRKDVKEHNASHQGSTDKMKAMIGILMKKRWVFTSSKALLFLAFGTKLLLQRAVIAGKVSEVALARFPCGAMSMAL